MRVHPWSLLALGLLLSLLWSASALGVTDSTPPTGTFPRYGYDYVTEEILVKSDHSDPESGMAWLDVSCEGGPVARYPHAAVVRVPSRDPEAGGCPGFGSRSLAVSAVNAAGLSVGTSYQVLIEPVVKFEYPLPARTGELFTIRPVYSEGYVIPDMANCRWEFRWGSTAALRDNEFDETFGSMLFEGLAKDGFCGEWTFTLPWVPVPQFELSFSGPGEQLRSGEWPDREVFKATVVGTDRRIRSSNRPIAQVLPSTYTPTVGSPVTYTRYLVGGAPAGQGRWAAWLGSGDDPLVWEKWTTSSTFTITPPKPGRLLVTWDRETNGNLLSATYDPPVRYKDMTDPNTTAPVQRLTGGTADATVPVKLSWSGTDKGWGIASYKLQRSVAGGSWTTVPLPTAKTTTFTQRLIWRTSYRYRVRATDKAGNVGAWDYGPTFTPRRTADTSTNVRYSKGWAVVADDSAFGRVLHESSTKGAAAKLTFTGRDVAWLAERGPGHGKAKVYINGTYIKTVDLEATADQPRRVVFTRHWSTMGTRTIRIELTGTAGRPLVSLDGFAILK